MKQKSELAQFRTEILIVFIFLGSIGFPGTYRKIFGAFVQTLYEYLSFLLQIAIMLRSSGENIMDVRLLDIKPRYSPIYQFMVFVFAESMLVTTTRSAQLVTCLRLSVTILFSIWLVENLSLHRIIGKPVFNLKRSLAHGKPMLILFIPVIAVSLYTMMDKLMLGAMSTKAQLGFYEAAEKIILCASSVITAFGTVMMPRMTKLFSDGNMSESQRYMKLSVEAVMASAFAISLGILSVSRLFAPIFWGKDFASCAYILSALALSIPFSGFANVIRMQYLIPNGMDRAYIISVILGAVSNLIANSLLISIYGALGAALGTVIAEGIVCIAQCFAVRKRISLQKYLNCIVPFGVAGLIMAAAVRVIDHVAIVTIPWLLIEIFVGSIVYCSLSLLYLYYTRNELLMAGIQKFSKR